MSSSRGVLIAFLALVSSICAQHCHPVRYMPLGDSITDIVCWRAYLWEKLQGSGYANINFVGSNRGDNPTGCNVLSYDKDGEGHSGFLATNIVSLNFLPGWLEQNPTDIVTIHLGSNDISHGLTASAILDAFTILVEQLRESNAAMKIIVAQIIPLPFKEWEDTVLELNARIPLWATTLSTSSSPILVVDQHTGFELDDTRDGVHPNEAGDRKMTERWYPALIKATQMVLADTQRTPARKPLTFDL